MDEVGSMPITDLYFWGSGGVVVSALAIASEGGKFDPLWERWSFLATEKAVPVIGHDVGMLRFSCRLWLGTLNLKCKTNN